MSFPNEKDLYEHLNFLRDTFTIIRSLAWNNASQEQIAYFVDAIHNIPELLTDWQFCNEKLLREYLANYDKKWKKTKSDVSLLSLYEKHRNTEPLNSNEVSLASEEVKVQDRIEMLLGEYLFKIAPTKDNKSAIFRDKRDGRLWELYDLKGGELYVRPFGLRHISIDGAIAKYDISTKIVDILRNIEKKI